jgi:hypothetical protein
LALQPLNAAQKQALDEALNIAIQARDLDMMANAVDSGANPNILLFKGIQNKEIAWVRSAVEHGADVNSAMSGLSYGDLKSYNAYPVFFWLTRNFDANIGDYLLSKGANIDALSPERDSALLAAVKAQNQTVIKYLVDKDADPLLLCADQKFPLKVLEDDSDWYDSSRKVPLVKAMMENLKRRNSAGTAPAPVNDVAPAATKQDIEISKPIELKRKPRSGFEL